MTQLKLYTKLSVLGIGVKRPNLSFFQYIYLFIYKGIKASHAQYTWSSILFGLKLDVFGIGICVCVKIRN